jgi:hypothetical protein
MGPLSSQKDKVGADVGIIILFFKQCVRLNEETFHLSLQMPKRTSQNTCSNFYRLPKKLQSPEDPKQSDAALVAARIMEHLTSDDDPSKTEIALVFTDCHRMIVIVIQITPEMGKAKIHVF